MLSAISNFGFTTISLPMHVSLDPQLPRSSVLVVNIGLMVIAIRFCACSRRLRPRRGRTRRGSQTESLETADDYKIPHGTQASTGWSIQTKYPHGGGRRHHNRPVTRGVTKQHRIRSTVSADRASNCTIAKPYSPTPAVGNSARPCEGRPRRPNF
ncbi:hypothetical protein B0J12DRAFT_662159 [Macrophomina phaseolina]|uniref:Uncharacterized protein n=1 Tax=Macrophomina phaseolina TaxID=35725 RepID=A0ABQ8GBP8_9PEZI|nr:hypothetical protein B0J12DRAFT_662159 [Macrophomina phaseolina]